MFLIIIHRLQTNGLTILGKSAIAIGVFLVCYIVSKKIVAKIRARVEAHSLVKDTYAQRNSKLIGGVVFILLMIFTILAIFQILGIDMAIIMGAISMSI
jgi:small-conductance mechanosensitive channel